MKTTTVRIPEPDEQERLAIRALTPKERLDAIVRVFKERQKPEGKKGE